jgi:predicted dehydrogenase
MTGVTLTRVASRNSETAGLVPHSCVVSTDWRDLLGAGDLDAVVLAVPPAAQVAIVAEAVRRGLPVLAEKPLSLSVADAESLQRDVEARGGLVMVDHIHLFNPAWETLKKIAATLGPVRAVRARAGRSSPDGDELGVLWNWGPHDVAMCLDLLGETPATASMRVLQRRPMPAGTGETIAITLAFSGDVTAEIELSNVLTERVRRFEVTFDEAVLTFQDYTAPALARNGVEVETDPTPPLQRVIEVFAASVASGTADRSDITLGVEVVRVLDRMSRCS